MNGRTARRLRRLVYGDLPTDRANRMYYVRAGTRTLVADPRRTMYQTLKSLAVRGHLSSEVIGAAQEEILRAEAALPKPKKKRRGK